MNKIEIYFGPLEVLDALESMNVTASMDTVKEILRRVDAEAIDRAAYESLIEQVGDVLDAPDNGLETEPLR